MKVVWVVYVVKVVLNINVDSSDIGSDDYNLPQISQMTRIFCLNTGYAHRFNVAGFAARLHR